MKIIYPPLGATSPFSHPGYVLAALKHTRTHCLAALPISKQTYLYYKLQAKFPMHSKTHSSLHFHVPDHKIYIYVKPSLYKLTKRIATIKEYTHPNGKKKQKDYIHNMAVAYLQSRDTLKFTPNIFPYGSGGIKACSS